MGGEWTSMSDNNLSVNRRTVLNSSALSVGAAFGVGAGPLASSVAGELAAPSVQASVEQVAVFGVEPEATVELRNDGVPVATMTADEQGTALFRDVDPGIGYTVVQELDEEESDPSDAFEVLSRDYVPDQSFYDEQTLDAGFGYLTVRDGTTLSYQLLLPDEEEWGDGPYPAVIDYSGYEPSNNIYDGLDDAFLELGYAVLGVNKRGSGCSGWAFDYFEWLQWADGYDIIETVAAQDWADGVALVGKSYPGITQLHVASLQPPSLDAIVPGHVVGDFYRDVVYPGGLQNATYAFDFSERQDAIGSFPSFYGWVNERAGLGEDEPPDPECAQNQLLRGHTVPLLDRLPTNVTETEFYQERAAWNLVEDIEVPTMLVNSWQDETTGGRPALLVEQFSDDIPFRFIGTNGDHSEYYGEAVFADIAEFLSFYVKEETPANGEEQSFADALAAYEEDDPVRIYWEMGAEGSRTPTFSTDFSAWPPENVEEWRLYLDEDGTLSEDPPVESATTEYAYEPVDPITQLERYWEHPPDGEYAAFMTDPLEEDATLLGPASVDLWVESTADDTDFEVTITEIRPDGTEVYVQTGWLRGSHRAEDETLATELRPWHTHQEEDLEPLESDGFTHLRVSVFPFGHLFREGSRIQLSVQPPGGNRYRWGFSAVEDPATNTIAHGGDTASSVVLPLVPDHEIEGEFPACGDLNEQPCRAAVTVGPPTIPGGEGPPQQASAFPDDGLYEDINGDGTFDIADVQALFENLHEPEVQEYAWAYNFSQTSEERVSVFDVQALFTRLQQLE